MDIGGRVALVTGAGAGIGRATALRLANEGAAVGVADVDETSGSETVHGIEAGGGRAAFVRADVRHEPDVRAMVDLAVAELGGLDILVNNAGIVTTPAFPHAAPDYAATKAAVARFSAALAPLHEQLGIRVNCICPDWVDTPMSRRTRARMTPEEEAAVVPPGILAPEEIADAAVELIRDDSLAGRVMTCWCGQPRSLLPVPDWS